MNQRRQTRLVTFYLSEKHFGIDINIVKEVNPNQDITWVPLSGREIRGLVNIRGQIVLVMDVNVIFGKAPGPIGTEAQLIILKTVQELSQIEGYAPPFDMSLLGDKPIALLVDKIGDIININTEDIEPPPSHMAQFKQGVAKISGSLIVIINPEDILQFSNTASPLLTQQSRFEPTTR